MLVMKCETAALLTCFSSCSVFLQLGLSWVTLQNERANAARRFRTRSLSAPRTPPRACRLPDLTPCRSLDLRLLL